MKIYYIELVGTHGFPFLRGSQHYCIIAKLTAMDFHSAHAMWSSGFCFPAESRCRSVMLSHCLPFSHKCEWEAASCDFRSQRRSSWDFHSYSCEEPFAVSSDCNGPTSHNSSESSKSQPQSSLPFKKRKAQVAAIFSTKGSNKMSNEGNSVSETSPNVLIDAFHFNTHVSERFPVYQYYPHNQPLKPLSNLPTTHLHSSCKHFYGSAFQTLERKSFSLRKNEWNFHYTGSEQVCHLSPGSKLRMTENLGSKVLNVLSQTVQDLQKGEIDGPQEKRKRKRGGQCVGQLWEFIYRMLQNPEMNPSVICWEDENKRLFRIVDTEKLAHLWGKRKGKPFLTYANMSRTMRYYRNGEGAFVPDDRKRVYGFGPKAKIDKLMKL